ncbi:MAG TPA: thermonuclease family protein [Pyrinomonadaceae bacterium]|jgi:endonuclease YncB( thermonuclease family)
MKRYLLPVCLLLLLLPALASARTIQALVVEVEDGNTFIAISVNNRLKVKLKAADAPELDQAYGNVARQHLADLILNKEVTIEISRLSADRVLVSRVYLNEMDVCQQMVRDGVAWYDRGYETELSDQEQFVYVESEKAARNERRGIWQEASPVAPWEFKKTETAKAAAGSPAGDSSQAAREARKNARGLSTEDLQSSTRPAALEEAEEAPRGSASQATMEYLRQASAYYLQRDFARAIPLYRKALELEKRQRTLNKNFWKVMVDNLGMAYGVTGDLKNALETFQYGLSQDPTYPMFHYNMACTYAEMGEMDKAISYLRRAFEYRANMIRGERLPDPTRDSSFRRFMGNEKFINALQEMSGR